MAAKFEVNDRVVMTHRSNLPGTVRFLEPGYVWVQADGEDEPVACVRGYLRHDEETQQSPATRPPSHPLPDVT